MGTIYYAVNKDKTKACDLGKSGYLFDSQLKKRKREELLAVIKENWDSDTEEALLEFAANEMLAVGDEFAIYTDNDVYEPDFNNCIVVSSIFRSERDRRSIGRKLGDED